MNITEKKAVVEDAKNKKLLCKIGFKYDTIHNVYLIPLICGEQLFLGTEEEDFILDGYTIRRFKDIKNIEEKSGIQNEILKKEGIVITTPEIEVKDWKAVFHSIKKLNKNVIVERETFDGEDEFFVIGKIDEIYKNFVYVYYFDVDGIWDEYPDKIMFNEITSVTFGSRYIDVFSKYIGEPGMKNR